MIYAWIWRKLPGPSWIKAAQSVLLVALIVAILFLAVFPWLSARLPFDRVTVSEHLAGRNSVSATATVVTMTR